LLHRVHHSASHRRSTGTQRRCLKCTHSNPCRFRPVSHSASMPPLAMPQEPTMSPDTRFRVWMLSSLLLAGASFVYDLFAAIHRPVAPEARLTYHVTQIAPDVSGRVVVVLVRNNMRVKLGDVLFRIDPDSYRTAVHEAELQVE